VTAPDYLVAIIGAGPGGITAAHLLRKHGITDFIVLERGDDVGGTWRDNHYPGLAVDIPTLWYQFPFSPNPNWSRFFAPGPEIHRYLRDTARKVGVYQHLRTDSEVTRQAWDDAAACWRLEITGQQPISARYVISAVGGYVNAKSDIDIAGADEFGGTILRPNHWDDAYDTTGTRIAIIGTGSSGVQIAAALAETAASVDIYQRTPAWVLPKVDFDIPPWLRRVFRIPGCVSAVNALGRLAMDAAMLMPLFHVLAHLPDAVLVRLLPLYDAYCRSLYRLLLRVIVKDAATRSALIPRYGILAKRPVISSAFLSALNRPTTNLITTPIRRITPTGVQTSDGTERPVDLIVAATGYELWTDPETYRPGTVLGRNGFDLAEDYHKNGLRAYAGTCHPELPNRWEIVGPLGFVGFAWLDFVETMAGHAVRIIHEADRRGTDTVTVSRDAFQRWNAKMAQQGRAVHLYLTACSPGLNTYFVNSQGETVYHRPQTITGARRFSRRSPLTDYQFTSVAAVARPLEAKEIPA
jgi:cation diffusion facilitator CzcD-associated flavoprotein CzcO